MLNKENLNYRKRTNNCECFISTKSTLLRKNYNRFSFNCMNLRQPLREQFINLTFLDEKAM